MATAQPGIDPPTDEVIALLCGDYLDHLNGLGGRSRAEIASIPLAPSHARRLREALDQMDELHKLATAILRHKIADGPVGISVKIAQSKIRRGGHFNAGSAKGERD
jgi:hypothetical protein